MSTNFTTPDYDAYILNAPEVEIAIDELQCKQCGEIVPEESITEVQLELHVCGDACAYKEVRDLIARAERRAS